MKYLFLQVFCSWICEQLRNTSELYGTWEIKIFIYIPYGIYRIQQLDHHTASYQISSTVLILITVKSQKVETVEKKAKKLKH